MYILSLKVYDLFTYVSQLLIQRPYTPVLFSPWPMKPLKETSAEVCTEKMREAVVNRAKGCIGKLRFFSLPALKHLFQTEVVCTVN